MNVHGSGVRALSIRARELGRHLRWAQEQTGMNNKTLARRLGWTETRLCRILSGRLSCRDLDVSAFLGVCGVTGDKRAMILRLCRPNVDDDVLSLPPNEGWNAYLWHASEAASRFEYQPTLIPWWAQALGYTVSTLSSWPPDNQRPNDELLTARRNGTSLLDRRGTSLILHEWALRNPVGSAEVMSEQLHHLLRLSVRTTLSIKVIPASAATPWIASGLTLLEFHDYDALVYREDPSAGIFIGKASDVDVYRTLLRCLNSAALDERSSRDLLSATAADFGNAANHWPSRGNEQRSQAHNLI